MSTALREDEIELGTVYVANGDPRTDQQIRDDMKDSLRGRAYELDLTVLDSPIITVAAEKVDGRMLVVYRGLLIGRKP